MTGHSTIIGAKAEDLDRPSMDLGTGETWRCPAFDGFLKSRLYEKDL